MEPDLEVGRVTAAADQLAATLASLAPVLRTYEKALVAEGFTRGEAVALCQSAQNSLLSGV